MDCVWNDWSQFSECSKTCGGGIQSRTRDIKVLNSYDGVPCDGPTSETKLCSLEECSPNGKMDPVSTHSN